MRSEFTISKSRLSFIAFIMAVSTAAFAQTYQPDPFFGSNGTMQHSFAIGTDRVNTAGLTAAGKIITGGITTNATRDFSVSCLQANGLPDNSFGTNGQASVDFSAGTDNLYTLVVQANGRILTGGSSKLANITSCVMARFLADGTLDGAFGTDGLVNFLPVSGIYTASLQKLLVQTDGKILAIGYFSQGGLFKGFVRRYLANGTIDNSFGTSGQTVISFANSHNYGIDATLNTDGSIVVFGQNYVSKFILGMAKLTSGGALDTGFSTDGLMTFSFGSDQNIPARIFSVSGGKYVVTGYSNNTGGNYKAYTSRFNSDGSIDVTYGGGGKCTLEVASNNYNSIYAAALLSDESILLSGESYINNLYQASVYKVSASGVPFSGFGTNGSTFINLAPNETAGNSILVSGTNYLVLGGNYSYSDNASTGFAAALQTNGSAATTFGTNGRTFLRSSKAQTLARHLDKLPGGKYMVSGQVENYDSDFFMSRLNTNGSLDPAFGNAGQSQGLFSGLDIYTDRVTMTNGDVVQLARSGSTTLNFGTLGNFTGAPTYSLVRSNPNTGFIDTTYAAFNIQSDEFTYPIAVRKDPQGRLVVLANSNRPTTGSGFLLRHTTTKKQDLTFGTGGKFNLYSGNSINTRQSLDLFVDSIGLYMVLTGEHSEIANTYGFMIEKMAEDGNLVPDFGLGGRLTVMEAYNIAFRPSRMFRVKSGFMLIGRKGDTATVARLSVNGELLGYSKFPEIKTLIKVVDVANGTTIAAGTGANDEIVLMRMLPNGDVDATFNGTGYVKITHAGNTSVVQDIVADPDGGFTILHRMKAGTESEKLALTRVVLVTGNQSLVNGLSQHIAFPNPAIDRIFWQNESQEIDLIKVFAMNGKQMVIDPTAKGVEGLDIRSLPTGKYWLLVENSKRTQTIPFVKK